MNVPMIYDWIVCNDETVNNFMSVPMKNDFMQDAIGILCVMVFMVTF